MCKYLHAPCEIGCNNILIIVKYINFRNKQFQLKFDTDDVKMDFRHEFSTTKQIKITIKTCHTEFDINSKRY